MSYISREKLLAFPLRRNGKHLDKKHANPHFVNGIETVLEYAEALPAENVKPVIHAQWKHCPRKVFAQDGSYSLVMDTTCSACNWKIAEGMDSPFCPGCGARMDADIISKEKA